MAIKSTGSFSSMSKTDLLITQHTTGAVGMVDILCHRPTFGQSPPVGTSWACAELPTLLGSFFCVSSLHGIVALGSGVHQDADPLPSGDPTVSPLKPWDAA